MSDKQNDDERRPRSWADVAWLALWVLLAIAICYFLSHCDYGLDVKFK